mmetsp:Transcript_1092/g.2377  ORF Transcript_1092/g.2377 Transcript_1092/m.2377 type:complete len:97 (-) Transcript_1092:808-1098(-)
MLPDHELFRAHAIAGAHYLSISDYYFGLSLKRNFNSGAASLNRSAPTPTAASPALFSLRANASRSSPVSMGTPDSSLRKMNRAPSPPRTILAVSSR